MQFELNQIETGDPLTKATNRHRRQSSMRTVSASERSSSMLINAVPVINANTSSLYQPDSRLFSVHEILGNSQLLGGLGANDGEGVCAAAEIDESGEPYLESMRDTENDKAA